MGTSTFAVGSLDALRALLRDGPLTMRQHADVVVIPTAAAFTGFTEAAVLTSAAFDERDVRVEALMVSDRAATSDQYLINRLASADLVVLCDGSPLHARSVWRANAFGDAINAASTLIAIGAVSSVLGDVMIDPRGGAPTTGLGFRKGAALCLPSSDEQMLRTRSLLRDVPLVVLGPTGIAHHDGEHWRVVAGDVVVTRGHDAVEL
jgi:mannose-6-phosphate isomerase-like protein (cupin superfamily)